MCSGLWTVLIRGWMQQGEGERRRLSELHSHNSLHSNTKTPTRTNLNQQQRNIIASAIHFDPQNSEKGSIDCFCVRLTGWAADIKRYADKLFRGQL